MFLTATSVRASFTTTVPSGFITFIVGMVFTSYFLRYSLKNEEQLNKIYDDFWLIRF